MSEETTCLVDEIEEFKQLVGEIEEFEKQYFKQYERLLKDIREVLDHIWNYREKGAIREVYGRDKKQDDGKFFKSRVKIAKKLADWRRRKPDTKIADIHDIVGLTVVLYYADEANRIIELATQLLAEKQIAVFGDPTYHRDFGYHAIHLIVISKNPIHFDLKVEIQFKTMLHDAWGSKTHDLTYKPRGQLDPKIKRIMESLGDSLQAIEVQSETLRNLIQQEKIIDTEHRRSINTLMASGLRKRFPDSPGAAKALFREIEKNSEHLSRCPLTDSMMARIRQDIENTSETIAEVGPARSLLHVWIACIRASDDLNHIAQLNIDNIRNGMKVADEMKSFLWASMMNYFIRDLEHGITLCRQGLRAKGGDTLTRYKIKNNLCYFLIESCMENPPDAAARKEEARKLRDELRSDDLPAELAAAVKFTFGTYDIAFADEEPEIRAGIAACEQAYQGHPLPPEPFVHKLLDVSRRQGWRRILYLETLKRSGQR